MKNLLLLFSGMFIALVGCQTKKVEQISEEPKVIGEEISYKTDSTTMNGYLAYSSDLKSKRPGVLVVHEWWGHNSYSRKRAEMLAEMGYVALAVDMYGEGKQAEHPQDAGKFAGEVFANLEEAKARFEQAFKTLQNHESVAGDKISAIGYCFGGSVVLSMANAGYDLDLVSAFHSGVSLPISADSTLKTRVLVFNGGADPFVPTSSVNEFKVLMDSVGADYKYVSYDTVMHSFTNPDADDFGVKFEMPLRYNAIADSLSWADLTSELSQLYN